MDLDPKVKSLKSNQELFLREFCQNFCFSNFFFLLQKIIMHSIPIPFWEENFNLTSKREWAGRTLPYAFLYSAAYVLFVLYVGPFLMKNRKGFDLKVPLIVWNSILAIFSIGCVLKMWPEFIATLQTFGLRTSYCWIGGLFDGSLGYWHYLFVLSKAWE